MNTKITLKLALFFVANMLCFKLFAVQPQYTDLPFAYGEQLWISTFDGAWETDSNEPVNMPGGGGWHSFYTASTGAATGAAQSSAQSGFSYKVRPGAAEGSRSARISSRSVAGIGLANGNFTTGRINAGSIRPANLTQNFNRTLRNDAAFNTPFESRPDSITVWVNFKPVNQNQLGRISVFIHGAAVDFQDPPARAADRNAVVAFAGLEFPQTNGEWVRLSIPFNYEYYYSFTTFGSLLADASGSTRYEIPDNVEPRFILVTMATNRVPGGVVGDTLWIDDFLMIYTPTLAVKNTSERTTFVLGETLDIAFTLTGTMSPYNLNAPANVVYLQLSDADGSFENPRILAQTTTDVSGVFSVEVPIDLPAGNYSVRVVTTNYPMISETIQIIVDYPETVITEYFAEICEGESFSDHNFTNLTTAGIHQEILPTIVHGFDSIIRLHLTVHPIEIHEYSATIYEGETFSDDNFTIENATMADSRVHELIVPSIIHGCDSIIRLNLTVIPGVSVEIVNMEDAVYIFPNPTRRELNIALADGLEVISLQIIDSSGRSVVNLTGFQNLLGLNQIDVSTLPQGIYFARIETNKGIVTKRFVKE